MSNSSSSETGYGKTELVLLPVAYEDLAERSRGIGMVVPFDLALDDEIWRWMPESVPLYISRTAYEDDTAITSNLAKDISDPRVIVPAVRSLVMAKPVAIGYACTMGSFVDGDSGERKLRDVMESAGGVPAITTSGALVEAVRALGVSKIAVATPYNQELSMQFVAYLEEVGLEITKVGYLGSEGNIMHIGYDVVRDMALKIDSEDAEAILFSCTNLRTFDLIEDLERELGKPVITANQATVWSTLRAGGLTMPDLNQQLFRVDSR